MWTCFHHNLSLGAINSHSHLATSKSHPIRCDAFSTNIRITLPSRKLPASLNGEMGKDPTTETYGCRIISGKWLCTLKLRLNLCSRSLCLAFGSITIMHMHKNATRYQWKYLRLVYKVELQQRLLKSLYGYKEFNFFFLCWSEIKLWYDY